MREELTWSDIVALAAARTPDKPVFTYLPDDGAPVELSYMELDRQARSVAGRLAGLGLAGRTALLVFPPGLDFVRAFFGCLYAGVVAVPVQPASRHRRSVERLVHLARDSGAEVALTTSAMRERLRARSDLPVAELLRLVVVDGTEPATDEDGRLPRPRADDLAFLQYTSGSTDAPRGVMVSHANLLANVALIQRRLGLSRHTRGVSWLPMYHDMGLIGSVLGTVHCGGSTVLMSPASFAGDPYRWLRTISEFRATISGGPNFAYDLCCDRVTDQQRAELDLSCWDVAFNGAEPVRSDTLRRFAARFAETGLRQSALLPCYGLAEASLIVSAGPPGRVARTTTAPDRLGEIVGCGRVSDEQRVAIVDPDSGRVLADGAVGEIWVSGPSVAAGYWHRPELTAATFGMRLAGTDRRFLRTGDLGFLDGGELFVTGRLKDLIIIRGRNHYPQDIEATAERSHAALRPHGCAAFIVAADPATGRHTDELVVVQEVLRGSETGERPDVAEQIRTAVAVRHEVRPDAVVLVSYAGLPRTSSGKIARHACRQAYLDGDLPELFTSRASDPWPTDQTPDPSTWDDEAVRVFLRTRVAALLGCDVDEVSIDRPVMELGLDSMDAVTIAHRVQAALGQEVATEDVLAMSIAELAVAIGDRPRLDRSPPPAVPVARTEPHTDHPLSSQQQAMWFVHEIAPESTAYLVGGAIDVRGPLDVAALRQALAETVARHSALRTTFPVLDGVPVQRVHQELAPAFLVHDARSWDAGRVRDLTEKAAHEPFDVRTGPLIRATVLLLGAGHYRVVLAAHHIVADQWSMELITKELNRRYGATPDREPIPSARTGFVELAGKRAAVLRGGADERLWEFWQAALDGVPTMLDLPLDRVGPPLPRFRGGGVRFTVDEVTTSRLRELARQNHTTLYTVLLAAYGVLLWRYSGQSDFLVGSPAHGRPDVAAADVVGCFADTVPIRCRVAPEQPFTGLLSRLHGTIRAAMRHAGLPFGQLLERTRLARGTGRRPLVQALFTLQRASGEPDVAVSAASVGHGLAATGTEFCGLAGHPVPLPRTGAQFDLAFAVAEIDGRLAAELGYDADLFEHSSVVMMADQLTSLLTGIAAAPGRLVRNLPLFDEAGRQVVLEQWNDTATVADPENVFVHRRIERWAARDPDATAVVYDDEPASVARRPWHATGASLTYAELDQAANWLAGALVELGVGPEVVVALHLPRSLDLVVAMVAVLKAGGAYLAVDPNLPDERVSFMVSDARAVVALTTSAGERLCSSADRVVRLDQLVVPPGPARAPEVRLDPENTAYVLYTSGSTGRPKGVQVPHRALANVLDAMAPLLDLGPGDRALALTTFSFDISGVELYLPLISGGVVHVVSSAIAADGHRLRVRIEDGDFALLQATPVTWQLLLDAGWTGSAGLTMLCTGEAWPTHLAAALAELGSPLWNAYAPTETTIYSTAARYRGNGAVALGRPVANTRLYVLDDRLEPVPPGLPGELYIAGDGVTTGYRCRPGLTAERFVPDPFAPVPGRRMYRSGDLVRARADGQIGYLGRRDNQVKVNGVRIELGEIEARLDEHPIVRRSVVAVRRGESSATLVAYVEPTDPSATAGPHRGRVEQTLRAALSASLPVTMVPGRFILLEALPISPNGKVDRLALPTPLPRPAEADGPRSRPVTPTESRLTGIVAALLEIPAVGRQDDFFELGGHSLLISRLALRIREIFGVYIGVDQVFERPTVEQLAELIDRSAGEADRPPAPIVVVDRTRFRARPR